MIESLIEYDSQVTETVAQPDCKDVVAKTSLLRRATRLMGVRVMMTVSLRDRAPGSGITRRQESVCTAATFASSSGPGRETGMGTKMGNRSGTDCDARP